MPVNLAQSIAETIALARTAARGSLDPIFILVPDRFTLQCERLLLKDAPALLNVRVLTFSMLYNLLSSEQGKKPPILDKTRAVLFLWQAIRVVEPDLKWFRKSVRHHNFAERMFNTLNQLTSSLVNFDKLPATPKFHDIVIIYRKYKELITNYSDSASMLGWLIANIKTCKSLKDTQVFICGFDHLSPQRLAVLHELSKYSKQLIMSTRTDSELELVATAFRSTTTVSAKPKPCEGVKLQALSSESIYAEVEVIANEIRGLLNEGILPEDIVVLLADFENTHVLYESVFIASNIPVNIDTGKPLSETPLVRHILDFLALSNHDNAENFLSFIRDEKIENFALKCNLGLKKYLKLKENDKLSVVQEIIAKFRKQKTVPQMVEILKGILFDCFGREKLLEVLANISELCGDLKLDIREFSSLLSTICLATKISTVPTYANRVLVSDLNEWQPHHVPYLFVVNTHDGNFPSAQADTDILTAFDIRQSKAKIEPTAKQQNARNRQHCMNVMASAKKSLVVSHIATTSANEPALPSELFEKLHDGQPVVSQIRSRRFARHKVMSALGSGIAFDNPIYYNSLLDSLEIELFEKIDQNIENGEELFFPERRASVTALESYINCPYCCFLERGLRLRRRELSKVGANIIGSLLHKIAEEFTRNPSKQQVLAKVLSLPEFSYFMQDDINKPLVAVLRREAISIMNRIEAQIKESDFKPKYLEKKLMGEIDRLQVVGIADRIDENVKGEALVIDYKTGKIPTLDGTKLQLPMYMDFYHSAVGAVYFPLSAGFSKDKKLKGLMPGINHSEIINNAKQTAKEAIDSMRQGIIGECVCGRGV